MSANQNNTPAGARDAVTDYVAAKEALREWSETPRNVGRDLDDSERDELNRLSDAVDYAYETMKALTGKADGECRYCANTGHFYSDPELGPCSCPLGKATQPAATGAGDIDRKTAKFTSANWEKYWDETNTAAPGMGELPPMEAPMPTRADAEASIDGALSDSLKAVNVLATMLRKVSLPGFAVADEIAGSIVHAQKMRAALAAQPAPVVADGKCRWRGALRGDGKCPQCGVIHNEWPCACAAVGSGLAERCGRHDTPAQPAPVVGGDVPQEANIIAMLVEVARTAHYAMDDCGDLLLTEEGAKSLSDALDALDGLPEIEDGYVRDGWCLAKDHLALLAARPGGEGEVGFYLASFRSKGSRGAEVLWWAPNNAGYTTDLEQAGIYNDLTPGYHDSEHTVPVPVSFIRELRVRRAVDPGDSLNGMFWTAEKLRAALAAHPAQAGGEKG